MNEHTTLCLCCHDKEHAEKVRRESRPRSIGKSHDSAVDKGFYLVMVMMRDEEVIAINLNLNTETAEGIGYDTKVLDRSILDSDSIAHHSSHGNE